MNTMYRNNETGYRQVKDAIEKHQEILPSPIITNKALFREQLLDEFNYGDKEKELKNTLYNSAKATRNEPWSVKVPSDESRSVDTREMVNKNFAYLKDAPKALLHVHSTVGLSVENLGALIEQWNVEQEKLEEEKEKAREPYIDLKIYYATVQTPDYNDDVENVLLYGEQVVLLVEEKADPGWTLVDFEPVNQGWFKNNISSFCLSEPDDIITNWTEFGKIFMRTNHLFRDRGFYEKYHTCFLEECMYDNIGYVELRTGFAEFADWTKKEEIRNSILFLRPDFSMKDYFYHADMVDRLDPVTPDAEFLELILSARDQAMVNWINAGKPDKELAVKVILTANRNKAQTKPEEAGQKIDAAISMKNGLASVKHNTPQDFIADMIIGFDFVDREDSLNGLTDTLHGIIYGTFPYEDKDHPESKLNMLKDKCRMELMRFFLHDGESIASISDIRSNAVTGPICSRHRIGHGFQMGTAENLASNTDLYGKHIMHYILNGRSNDVDKPGDYPINNINDDIIRKDYITEPVIELCPISNYMLGYVKNLEEHPAISLMENGILAVICNDDPQIFGSRGLSHDYAVMYMALKKHFENRKMNAQTKAYEYLKISFFLGYFYEEMSKKYYKKLNGENSINVVNDDLSMEDEWNVFTAALCKFKRDWSKFVNPPTKKDLPTPEIVP